MRLGRTATCTPAACIVVSVLVALLGLPTPQPSPVGAGEASAPTDNSLAASVRSSAESGRARAEPLLSPGSGPASCSPRRSARRVETPKKGVSLWKARCVTRSLRKSGSSWFWNWDSAKRGVRVPPGVEFVPMMWGAGSVTPARLAEARRSGRQLLAFNEPDHTDQSNMSVEQALDLWPDLEATGLRLSSPAVAENAAVPGGWLDRFMQGARQRGLRVDFIALHWYGADFDPERATEQLRAYLSDVHERYGLPVWLTEYSLMRFDGGDMYPPPDIQSRFVTQSTAMLEALDFVERYSWFSLPAQDAWRQTGLFSDRSVPTPAGRAYSRAGRLPN